MKEGGAVGLSLLSKPFLVIAVLDALLVSCVRVPGAMAEWVLAVYCVCHVGDVLCLCAVRCMAWLRRLLGVRWDE